jgi:hypothetical protein
MMVGIFAVAVFAAITDSTTALLAGAIVVVPIALTTAVGAATSIVAGAPSPTLYLDFPFPEFGTLWLIVRQCVPPAIVVTALIPVAIAHDASGRGESSIAFLLVALLIPALVVAITCTWLGTRRLVSR